jgi:hypothetical protein
MRRARPRLLTYAASLSAALLVSAALAQQPAQQKRAPAPAKPYKSIALTLPQTINDPSFDEFRRKLAEISVKKDSNALSRLVVAQGFFWKSEKGEKADKNKSGFDNFSAAVQLNAKDGSGWDQLAGYAFDPTGAPVQALGGAVCSPADPVFNEQEFENLLKDTQVPLEDWGYPLFTGIEVRSGRTANAPVVEKLGLHFIRVIPDESMVNTPANEMPTLQVVTPTGKTGYVPAFALAPLGNDQLCYRKEADGWKIIGYVGGEP